jgi:hypothetical protein
LTAVSARQREAIRDALEPWQTSARRIDRSTQWLRRRAVPIGFAAGFGAGTLAAFRPRLLVRAARTLLMAWPVWRFARDRLLPPLSSRTPVRDGSTAGRRDG